MEEVWFGGRNAKVLVEATGMDEVTWRERGWRQKGSGVRLRPWRMPRGWTGVGKAGKGEEREDRAPSRAASASS